jgi:lysophospholipase L1-like esterase
MRTRLFWVMILSVALNGLAVIGLVVLTERKGGRPWLDRQVPRVLCAMQRRPIRSGGPSTSLSVYGRLPVGPGDIVMLGDDLLEHGAWHELLGDPRAKNRGIVGEDTHTMLERLGQAVAGGPRHVVVSCGSNNLRTRMPRAQTVREYARIVATLVSRSPGTDLWLLPVLPVNQRLYRKWIAPDEPYLNAPGRREVEALNAEIRALAVDRPRVHFLDLPEVVDPAGELRQDCTLDGLHLNGEGYQRVAMRLRDSLLGAPVAPREQAGPPGL